ncbi:hypothetical protein EDD11_000726 [Mortierella claussenii]|nr:hypothetical protein EDD11_000726 [Mortierella claussenii]
MSSTNITSTALRIGAIALIGGVLAYWYWSTPATKTSTKTTRTTKTVSTTATAEGSQGPPTAEDEKQVSRDSDQESATTAVATTSTSTTTTFTATTTTVVESATSVTPEQAIRDRSIQEAVEDETRHLTVELTKELREKDDKQEHVDNGDKSEKEQPLAAVIPEAQVIADAVETLKSLPINKESDHDDDDSNKLTEVAPVEFTTNSVDSVEDQVVQRERPSVKEVENLAEVDAAETLEPVIHVTTTAATVDLDMEVDQEQEECLNIEEHEVDDHAEEIVEAVVEAAAVQEEMVRVEVKPITAEELSHVAKSTLDAIVVSAGNIEEEEEAPEQTDQEEIFELVFERDVPAARPDPRHTPSAVEADEAEGSDQSDTPTTLVGEELELTKDTLQTLQEVSRVAKHSELNARAQEFKPSWLAPTQQTLAARLAPAQVAPAKQGTKIMSRCHYWPNCTNKACKYTHPSQPCRDADNCRFGDRCVFMHPKDLVPRIKKNPKNQQQHDRRPSSAAMSSASPVEPWGRV